MVDATVSNTVGHNARAGSTPALGTKLVQSGLAVHERPFHQMA